MTVQKTKSASQALKALKIAVQANERAAGLIESLIQTRREAEDAVDSAVYLREVTASAVRKAEREHTMALRHER